jgi:site-specific DNA recombinase
LIWNPETGKRVSRPQPKAGWVIQAVPELRISDEFWNAAKTRQGQLRATRVGKKTPGYWDRRRPRFLLSGLMWCGTCSGGFMNRLQGQKSAQQDESRRALKQVGIALDRPLQALMDGVPAARVKDKMAELEVRKADLEMQLGRAAKDIVLVHLRMANPYREESGRWRKASNQSTGSDALSHMRQLIDHVLLTPVEDETGRKSLSVDPHGTLAGILQWRASHANRWNNAAAKLRL